MNRPVRDEPAAGGLPEGEPPALEHAQLLDDYWEALQQGEAGETTARQWLSVHGVASRQLAGSLEVLDRLFEASRDPATVTSCDAQAVRKDPQSSERPADANNRRGRSEAGI